MGLKDLEKLLTENGDSKSEQIKIDWDAEKHKWLEAVRDFYNDVESWVGKLPNLKIEYKVHTITEENIGRYEINKMIITMLNQHVTLEPMGSNLIGAYGRIDSKGKKGLVKFVLVPRKFQSPKIIVSIRDGEEVPPLLPKTDESKLELVWKIATPAPHVKFIDVDGDAFSDVLMAVL